MQYIIFSLVSILTFSLFAKITCIAHVYYKYYFSTYLEGLFIPVMNII